MVNEEKVKQVEELAQEATESEAVVFSDYSGLTVAEMSELRRKLAERGADLRVVKNTLLGLALEKAGLKDGELEGPTAVLFSRSADPLESVKTLVSFLKEKGRGAVKFGFFEKSFTSPGSLSELAALPSRAVLQSYLVSRLMVPIHRLVYVLSFQERKLVTILDRVSRVRGGEISTS